MTSFLRQRAELKPIFSYIYVLYNSIPLIQPSSLSREDIRTLMMYFYMVKIIALIVLFCCLSRITECKNIGTGRVRRISDGEIEVKRTATKEGRFRRDILRDSCGTKAQCTGNQTVFEIQSQYYNCHCDNACYEVFQDCCPDFVKTCGLQSKTEENIFDWKCVELDRLKLGDEVCSLDGPTGVWMVQSCPKEYHSEETRTKCTNASREFSYPFEFFLPVVGQNNVTYRNKHCALCNGETNYTSWNLMVKAFITPPVEYNSDQRLQFTLANGGYIENIAPRNTVPRRYCAGTKYIDSCPDKNHTDANACINGAVETLSYFPNYFKNKACASCNGTTVGENMFPRSKQICKNVNGSLPQGFSIVFNTGGKTESGISRVIRRHCPPGLVNDETLGYCREELLTSVDDISDVFLVALWFEPGSIDYSVPDFSNFSLPAQFIPTMKSVKSPTKNDNITTHLKSALVQNVGLTSNQITSLRFHQQTLSNTYLVATFRLTLTPFQGYIFANQNTTTDLNISNNSLKFLQLLKFTSNFTIYSGKFRYPVIKLETRQLACYEGTTLQPHEYTIDKNTGNILQNTTGEKPSRDEYTILKKDGGNITICRKLVLSGCHNGSFVPLNESEYTIYQNLSIFHKATNMTTNFGDYQIRESSSGRSDSFANTSLPKNSSIAICLPFRATEVVIITTPFPDSEPIPPSVLAILGALAFGVFVFVSKSYITRRRQRQCDTVLSRC